MLPIYLTRTVFEGFRCKNRYTPKSPISRSRAEMLDIWIMDTSVKYWCAKIAISCLNDDKKIAFLCKTRRIQFLFCAETVVNGSVLTNRQLTNHGTRRGHMIDLQTWFLARRVFMTQLRWDFNYFGKFAFLPLLGALLFSKRALKAKRHNCGHRDIISWYAGSMWQRNVGKKYYVWKLFILMSLGAL